MDADALESAILREIVPSPEVIASIKDRADRMVARIMECASKRGLSIGVRLAGSYSKGTFLSNPDLDVFLMFPKNMERKIMTHEGLSIGEEILDDAERAFAENPYISGFFEEIDVDMVPCYKLEDASHIITSMDRTPFHTDYIMSNLTDEGKNQVRLLKKFMKGIGTYGAEPNVRGFSGYLCELLIVRYGSFRNALEAACGWKKNQTIYMEGFKGPSMKSALVFHDPVDPKRNVASAVHIDTMCRFMQAAVSYLKDPRREFFFPASRNALDRDRLRDMIDINDSRLVSVRFSRPDILKESIDAQMWKTRYALCSKLDSQGFGTLRANHAVTEDSLVFVFEIQRDVLPRCHKHPGPPIWVDNAEQFLDRWVDNQHGAPFIEDGVWVVVADRQYTDACSMLAKEAAVSGIGKDVDVSTMEVLSHDETLTSIDRMMLTELLQPMMPWEIRDEKM